MTEWLAASITTYKADDGTTGASLDCGNASLDIRNWRRDPSAPGKVDFEISVRFHAWLERQVAMVNG